jgi:hypothetical protein
MNGELFTTIDTEIRERLLVGTAVLWFAGRRDVPEELLPYMLAHAADPTSVDNLLTAAIDMITARLALMYESNWAQWQRSPRFPDLVILLGAEVVERHAHKVGIVAKSGPVVGVVVVARDTVV